MFLSQRPALISIHDVAPQTLADVGRIVDYLMSAGLHTVTLLVIPGENWSSGELDRLRRFLDLGCELAGHGWIHRCSPPQTWYHRAHSACLSRGVAEHLSLDGTGIAALIRDCYGWFAESRLAQPELYVPPAWALGPVARSTLQQLPFRYYETLSGVYDARHDVFHGLPLLGYEADTGFRSLALRSFNLLMRGIAAVSSRPVRVSIHPHDLRLRLGDSLKQTLAAVRHAVSYSRLGERF